MPWRDTRDPYKILVSEVMLQQTQVVRVLTYYAEFTKRFPTVRHLANASLKDVLQVWQGLGYNRRGLMLHRAAQAVVKNHTGKIPQTYDQLITLPGIGPTTAAGILNFAFGIPTVYLETNVRSVFIHEFFRKRKTVDDKEVSPLVATTMPKHSGCRDWYYALLDYGAYLKKQHKNPSRRSAHYAKQSKFIGSNRQIRSTLLRTILEKPGISQTRLRQLEQFSQDRISRALDQLLSEGFITKKKNGYVVL